MTNIECLSLLRTTGHLVFDNFNFISVSSDQKLATCNLQLFLKIVILGGLLGGCENGRVQGTRCRVQGAGAFVITKVEVITGSCCAFQNQKSFFLVLYSI